MNLTSLDFAILGLLTQNAKSGYQIRQVFETTAMGNYSSSPGSIYPALKKLQQLGLVDKKNQEEKKSPFHITESGSIQMKKWLETPVVASDIPKNLPGLLLRFAFMDETIDLRIKLTFLYDFKRGCQDYLNSLLDFHKKQSQYMPINGLLAFELGISSYETHIDWAEKAIERLKNDQHES